MDQNILKRFAIIARSYCSDKGRLIGLTLVGIFILLISSHFVWVNHSVKPEHIYLVKLNELPIFGATNNVGITHLDNLLAENNARVEDLYPEDNEGEMGRWIVVTDEKDIAQILKTDSADVQDVEDGALIFRNPEDDTVIWEENGPIKNDKTWGIRIPKVPEALKILKPTRQITVGVVDTGCDVKHPALAENLVPGYNFAGGNATDPSNRNSNETHATHVSGTIVAKLNPDDESGFFGIAQSVAKVMPVRVLDETGSGTLINVTRGITYAADHGCNVINMSLGAPSYSRALHDAVKYAVNDKNVTVVCAKGNANTDRAFYPAEFPEVIRVTATQFNIDGTEERAYFSNYGKNSTCAAPGHFTYSTLPGGKYGFASGTSMACPHAAACAAVILSERDLRPETIKKIMEDLGDELQTEQPIGKRINLLKFIDRQ